MPQGNKPHVCSVKVIGGASRSLFQPCMPVMALALAVTTLSVCCLLWLQVCKIGFMSTTEIYPLDGVHSSAQRRRDMRPGKQLGKLLSAVEGQLQLRVAFDGWLPGEALDTLHLQEDGNTLVVQHKASIVGKGSAHFQEVYRRKN